MTFAQRRNHLTTHFSQRIPVVKRRISVRIKADDKNKRTIVTTVITFKRKLQNTHIKAVNSEISQSQFIKQEEPLPFT